MDHENPPAQSVLKTRDGSPTLFSERYQQTYHSIHGSVTEANHIFLKETGIKDRLQKNKPTRILEIGLGTGLNFLLTAQAALSSDSSLAYWAMEHTIISISTFRSLHLDSVIKNAPLLASFTDALAALEHAAPEHAYSFPVMKTVELHVLKGDASKTTIPNNRYHAVYQDAFSPDVNEELWTSLFFQRIYNTMQPGSRLTTFSVRRSVRDALSGVGFAIQKKPGPPGGKREMLLAIKPNHAESDQ